MDLDRYLKDKAEQTISQERKALIKEYLVKFMICKMKPVNYGNYKVLWSFELDNKSTFTLTADEFAYYLLLVKEYREEMIEKDSISLLRNRNFRNNKD